jgi:alkanesulfonate monooxygenase SsuD/methylene tetrahydromethanopterin reductase-like flavin-dependent oxidoreductase (luciferase family)
MPAAAMTRVIQQAEHTGLEGIWIPQLWSAPFTGLGAAAMVTERLKLGAGVALAFTRSPLETALAALDVDTISGGRAVLGIGTSIRWWNEAWHGVTYGKPIAHLREVIDVVRRVVAGAHKGDLGVIEGRYHKLDLRSFKSLAPPVRKRIPIYIPAIFEAGIALAAEVADGIPGHPIWSARWLHNEVRGTLETSLKKFGRNRAEFDLNVWVNAAISSNRKQAIDDARRTVAFYARFVQYEKFFAAHGFGKEARAAAEASSRNDLDSMFKAIPDEMANTFALAGTRDEVRERIDDVWRSADSITITAPTYYLEPSRIAAYQSAIAQTFYA